MKLPLPSLLGPLVAEHRTNVVEPVRPGHPVEPRLDERSHDGSGSFGPQAHRIFRQDQREHLFPDDVGRAAHAAHEQLGGLNDRRADLAESVPVEERPGDPLDPLPFLDLSGENVPRSPQCLVSRQ